MNKAESAHLKIKTALDKYGSDVTLRSIVIPPIDENYDPRNPPTPTQTDTPLKAFINSEASKDLKTSMPKEIIGTYEMSITLQSDVPIVKKENTIIKGGDEYQILYVKPKEFMNLILQYELLVAKA